MESTHYVLSRAGKCTCNTPTTAKCQTPFVPVPSVTNTKTSFPPAGSPDRTANLMKILRYHLIATFFFFLHIAYDYIQPFLKLPASFHMSSPPIRVKASADQTVTTLLCLQKASHLGGSRLPACLSLTASLQSSRWGNTNALSPALGVGAGATRETWNKVHSSSTLPAPSPIRVLELSCCPFLLVLTLLLSLGFLPSQSHLFHRPACIFFRQSSRKRKLVTPANQEGSKGSFNFLLLCQCCLISSSSEKKAYLPRLLQQLLQVNAVYTVSQSYVTFYRQIKQVSFPTQRPHNISPQPCARLCTWIIMLQWIISLLTTELFRKVMLLIGKSICTDWTINLTGRCEQLITDGMTEGRENQVKRKIHHKTQIFLAFTIWIQ